jgi:hypothetical protein
VSVESGSIRCNSPIDNYVLRTQKHCAILTLSVFCIQSNGPVV